MTFIKLLFKLFSLTSQASTAGYVLPAWNQTVLMLPCQLELSFNLHLFFFPKINTVPDSLLIIAEDFGKAGALLVCDVNPKKRVRKQNKNIEIIIPQKSKP